MPPGRHIVGDAPPPRAIPRFSGPPASPGRCTSPGPAFQPARMRCCRPSSPFAWRLVAHHLPPRDLLRGDHLHRPRTARANDARQRRSGHVADLREPTDRLPPQHTRPPSTCSAVATRGSERSRSVRKEQRDSVARARPTRQSPLAEIEQAIGELGLLLVQESGRLVGPLNLTAVDHALLRVLTRTDQNPREEVDQCVVFLEWENV